MAYPDVITIDGPAGAGKSTLGERIARQLGYLYLDTGIMYRALALAALERGVDPTDVAASTDLAQSLDMEVLPPTVQDGRQYTVLLDGRDVTWELRRPEVERTVSLISSPAPVREVMRARQRAIGKRGHVVMVGRDIGSIVLPEAPVKIYLEASVDERTRRRVAELRARGREVRDDEVRDEIIRRDSLDRHVMEPAPDAMVISSDGLSPDEVVAAVLEHIRRLDP
ncbi:MAG: (d)CMP kinase [Chloroflexota bacterium]|nr:MAG: (d)CMP kinase [Chloroflexota bacterium]